MKFNKQKEVKVDECAVYVRNAWKTYKKPNYLFTDLELTMLNATMQIRSVRSFWLWKNHPVVLYSRYTTIGLWRSLGFRRYMPQELALYGDFSIKETMLYFGWIFGLKTKNIEDRTNFLVQLKNPVNPTIAIFLVVDNSAGSH
nr:unnamed protein product [Callosobruchus analis]